MAKARSKSLTVSIIGPGRLGTALALNLPKAGYEVSAIVSRPRQTSFREAAKLAGVVKSRAVRSGKTPIDSALVWITVPDGAIADVASRLAATQDWRGKTVFHSSGAFTSEVLSPLREKGAKVASVHPGMTFVRRSVPRFVGVPFGVEGDPEAVRLAKRIVRGLGGKDYPIKKQNKVLYHAFGSFASPMLIALMAALERVGEAAGIPQKDLRAMAAPLLRQTLSNYLEYGAAEAFSGPLVRGDVATVRRHLEALKKAPEAREIYLALAKTATKALPVKNRRAVKRELDLAADSSTKP